jgi:hypothetical protein
VWELEEDFEYDPAAEETADSEDSNRDEGTKQ